MRSVPAPLTVAHPPDETSLSTQKLVLGAVALFFPGLGGRGEAKGSAHAILRNAAYFLHNVFFDSGTKYLIPPLPLPGDVLSCCLSWEESGKRCVYWFPALLAALKGGLAPYRSFCTLVSNLLTAYNLLASIRLISPF